jgi:hypothetical protein
VVQGLEMGKPAAPRMNCIPPASQISLPNFSAIR